MNRDTRELFDRNAERSLLGCILLDGSQFHEVSDVVRPEDFHDTRHARVFEGVGRLLGAGKPADTTTLGALLPDVDRDYLLDILAGTVTAANTRYYAEAVAGLAARRRLLAVAREIGERAYDRDADVDELLAEAERSVLAVGESLGTTARPVPLADVMASAIEKASQPLTSTPGIPSLSTKFNATAYGYRPKMVYWYAARPGEGKTSVALCEAIHAAQLGYRSHIFSMEMDRHELGIRGVSVVAQVPGSNLINHDLQADSWANITQATSRVNACGLVTIDDHLRDLDRMLSRGRRLAREGVQLFIWDFFLLLKGSRKYDRDDLRVADFAYALKEFAKETATANIVLTQFRKEDPGGWPEKQYLYGGSGIENSADVICLMFDPVKAGVVYPPTNLSGEQMPGLMFGDIQKNRGGQAPALLRWEFIRHTTTFRDWTGPDPIFTDRKGRQ